MNEVITPPAAAAIGGPVSEKLEQELRGHIVQHGLVLWLDQGNHYGGFVDRLRALRAAGALPYEVHGLRGSYLKLLMELEDVASGTEKVPVVVHLPGVNEESVKQTPLYELYAAGSRYRKALDTLVLDAAAQQVSPAEIEAFRASGQVTLADADRWLAELLQEVEGSFAAGLRGQSPRLVIDDLLNDGPIAKRVRQAEDAETLYRRLGAWLGLTDTWRETALTAGSRGPADIAFAAASWALCVEYVNDLEPGAPLSEDLANIRQLPAALIKASKALTAHLREHHPEFYTRTADETEYLLHDQIAAAKARDLGKIDTFRFEEQKIFDEALAALARGEFAQAERWAKQRLAGASRRASFWLQRDPTRQSAWQLIEGAAALGVAIEEAGAQLKVESLDEAIDAYKQRGARVDQRHRQLEQLRVRLLDPRFPAFDALRARLDEQRGAWRVWADAWARDFSALCRARGFLPSLSHQQRTLFDEVVKPMTQESGVTAYFVIDAFRYEMGDELLKRLQLDESASAQLGARLAELPTVTEVGMNVLAPVSKAGKLQVAMSSDAGKVMGFQSGEFRVTDPTTRKRAMHDRVGGVTCPWLTLDEVLQRDATTLKRTIAQSRLVVVHSQEIDNAGEKGVGTSVFDDVLQKLRTAWHLLREANVRRFVFTSDHGFLLLDSSNAVTQTHGRKTDPHRRHVFSPLAADHAGELRVPLEALGYEGGSGHLMFPESTALFDTGGKGTNFAHGGNSLQERVIPVLTVTHRAPAGASVLEYDIAAQARDGVMGLHCIEASVRVRSSPSLGFTPPAEVELMLRVMDASGVRVELVQVRGKATVAGSSILASVGESFEVFFRLLGPNDARVLLELWHPSNVFDVKPTSLETRFAVTATKHVSQAPPAAKHVPPSVSTDWLAQFDDEGVRKLFEHLQQHHVVTEDEAVKWLGSPRAVRRFSNKFEEYAQKAPFTVRIDTVGGVKRYVAEGLL